jgi:HD superfamily phosphohydrolase
MSSSLAEAPYASYVQEISCPLYRSIDITPTMKSILDTPQMQRLRELKQLGAAYYVFPSGTHTRLEHSLGVAHLARTIGSQLQRNHPRLKITDRIIELLGIAGMVHDIGHGPFSHLYDSYVKNIDEQDHEERGLVIFKELCKNHQISLTDKEIKIICEMVDPSPKNRHNWMYQIVANKSCQIDVDKIDYIRRDSYHLKFPFGADLDRIIKYTRISKTKNGLELAWHKKIHGDIYSLFMARYELHKRVYTHHTIKSYEYLITNIMKSIYTQTSVPLSRQTDAIVTQYCYDNPENKWAKSILHRKHPHMYKEFIVTCNNKEKYKGFHHINRHIFVSDIKIGFVSGEKSNPMDDVNFYTEKNSRIADVLSEELDFRMKNKHYQEILVRMYIIDDSIVDDEGVSVEYHWNKLKKDYGQTEHTEHTEQTSESSSDIPIQIE